MKIYIILLLIILVIIISGCRINGEKDANYLSLKNTKMEKGIAAIFIVLHHLSQHLNVTGPLLIMRYIGFIMVAVFFFISGYGLAYSLRYKLNYLNCFFKNRILPILIPYWIINTLNIIYYLVKGHQFTSTQYILSYVGFDIITGTWFVTSILCMYIFFWIAFKTKYSYVVLFFLTFSYYIVCILLKLHSSYTASISAFLLGVLWVKLDVHFVIWMKERYLLKLFFCIFVFGLAFLGRLFLSLKGIDNEMLHLLLRNLVSILFVVAMLAVTQRVSFNGTILNWLGNISYELYVVHYVLLTMLNGLDVSLYLLFIMFGGLILSTLFWKFDKQLIKLIKTKK